LRRALDPAIRAHGGRAVQTGDQGAGLGLTLSYEIVVNSTAGNVDSQLDIVTEFVVTLPRTMAANDGVRT
jgi:hypothetical protein